MIGICNAGSTVFDASQYAFFGNDVVEEVELGGLEDEEDDVPQAGFDEADRDEVFCKWKLIFSCLTCMFAVFVNTSLFKNSSRSHLICKIGKLTHFFWQGETLGASSEIDDLTSTFSKVCSSVVPHLHFSLIRQWV